VVGSCKVDTPLKIRHILLVGLKSFCFITLNLFLLVSLESNQKEMITEDTDVKMEVRHVGSTIRDVKADVPGKPVS